MCVYLILTAFTLSIDTLAVGIACGVGRLRFSASGWVAFFLTGLAAVAFSAMLGGLLIYIPHGRTAGGALLALTGTVMILQQSGFLQDIPLLNLISAPEKTDTDNNRVLDFREAAVLSLALSIDSCIACAGTAGGILLAAAAVLFQPLFICVGIIIGRRFALKSGSRFCGITAGVLLLALGVENICL